MVNKFKNKNKINQNYLFFQRIVSALPRFIIEFLAVIILLGICILFTILEYSNAETISLLALISLVTIRMIPAFQQITGAFTAIKFFRPSFNLISKEIYLIQNNIDSNVMDNDRLKFEKDKIFNKITINNLSFKYESKRFHF